MIVCPKGTPLQKKANYLYSQRLSVFSSENSLSWTHEQVKDQTACDDERGNADVTANFSERSECGSIRADKKAPLTARDEFVCIFVNALLDILLKSWEGKPCLRPKLTQQSESVPTEPKDFGESELDLVPCEEPLSASTADLIKDLYNKRTSNLSKELSTGTSKLKKSSSSNCSEYLKDEDFELPETGNPSQTFPPDEDVYFVFTNNVSYKGRAFRRLMDGEGTYFWEDGSTYQGKFEDGCATGTGVLRFPDLSVYEGEVYKAFRHGEGLLCMSESPVMYSGQWWLGRKHGEGMLVYNEPSEGLNFYKGQWENGVKEGFGIRQYTSGAKYIGFWSNGNRHGKGVMLWSNHDIYEGEWKHGLMHGYGEYTWNGFINNSLSCPVTNTYRGFWSEGKRNGQGVFETMNDILIETVWVENLKEGPGAVICSNGTIVSSDNLFNKDKQSLSKNKDEPGMACKKMKNNTSKRDTSEDHFKKYLNKMGNVKAISIPIYLPIHTLDLSPYTKFLSMKNEIVGSEQDERESSSTEHPNIHITGNEGDGFSVCLAEEEKSLRNSIVLRLPQLRACYEYYATIACEKPPSFKCILLRIFLWQMLIDCNIPSSKLSLVDIDKMLAEQKYLFIRNDHDPFERIQFWKFVHILIILSWNFYGKHVLDPNPLDQDERIVDFLKEFDGSVKENILKKAFDYFLDKEVFKKGFMSAEGKNGFLQENDLAPMKPMYIIYRQVGEPHSAKDFVKTLCVKSDQKTIVPELVKYFVKLPMYKVKEGKNVMTVAGELSYVPGSEPFNFPQIMGFEKKTVEPQPDFTWFSNLKAKKVIKCLTKVCPGIADDEFIVNMNYQLTFLEFYKAIVLCTELSLKMNVMNTLRDKILEEHKAKMKEYEMLLSEYEKMRNSTAASSKKSRQLSDMSRKGKK